MALTKETRISRIDITPDGKMVIKEATVILRDGKEISRTEKRSELDPGKEEDRTKKNSKNKRIKDIANKLWTPERIAAREEKVARELKTGK